MSRTSAAAKAAAGEGGWVRSNPTRVNEWIEEVVAEKNRQIAGSGSQMRRMLKLMKRFCRSRNGAVSGALNNPEGREIKGTEGIKICNRPSLN